MVQNITIDDLVSTQEKVLIVDVRSPSEYNHAAIPYAINLPLFLDDERANVGTTYKQQSREQAIKMGLDYFGPKMRPMVEVIEKLQHQNCYDHIVVQCWRGGMRSSAVSWLLDLYGFSILKLEGGYKAYRNWVLDQFNYSYNFQVLGGYTGSGKTKLLRKLKENGKQIIDLEKLACHKGSSFGHIDMPDQPTQEMFENQLAQMLYQYKNKPIWIEDESQRIGHIVIPQKLWNTLRISPISFLQIPFEQRLQNIIEEYGSFAQQDLFEAIIRIQKRLGGLNTKLSLEYIQNGEVEKCFAILLEYYDRSYDKGLKKRENWESLCNYISPAQAITLFDKYK